MRSVSVHQRARGGFLRPPCLGTLLLLAVGSAPLEAQNANPAMNFFLVPAGPSYGTEQPAVRVSDSYCATLAYPQGFGNLRWRAYLDGKAADGEGGQVARDRIGPGPYYNFYGVLIAESVAQLHSDDNNLWAESAVTVTGEAAPAGFTIPTGSQLDGSDFTRQGPFFCFGIE